MLQDPILNVNSSLKLVAISKVLCVITFLKFLNRQNVRYNDFHTRDEIEAEGGKATCPKFSNGM